jgi:hypothetical protein
MWIGFLWLRMGSSNRIFEQRTFGLNKRGIFLDQLRHYWIFKKDSAA